jgi:hypothetical protein
VTYQRIEAPGDLPPPGELNARAREKQDLDFKTFADGGKMWEHAKDVAAFANALGGVLLIGADNTTDRTALKYPGLAPTQTVADVAAIYENAGVMCSPAPNVDVVPIKGPGGVDVVAVNVDPSVHQVVASPGGKKGGGDSSQNLWRFPIRRGSQTDEIAPEDLAMYMNQPVRRAYLMLMSIPPKEREQGRLYYPDLVSGRLVTETAEIAIQDLPSKRNFVVVAKGDMSCRIPLADVVDVWEESEGVWAVKVTGTLERGGGFATFTYRPRF